MIKDTDVFNNFKALIFDLDGTLIDSEPYHLKAWNEILSSLSMPAMTYEYSLSVGGIKSSKICAMMCEAAGRKDIDPESTARRKTQLYIEKYMQDVPLFDGIARFLKEGYEKGLKIAVATGSQLPETRELLKRHGLLPMVGAIVSSDQVQNCKPAPDTYLIAAERVGVAPCDCVVFEDTNVGLQGIKNAGMTAIQVKGGRILSDFIRP